MKPQDNSANMRNPNHGTSGTNKQRDQQEGNRGKQLNPLPNNANTPPNQRPWRSHLPRCPMLPAKCLALFLAAAGADRQKSKGSGVVLT